MFKTAMIGIFLSVALNAGSIQADCRGCCSLHKGVVCRGGGVTTCKDGASLSVHCKSKGCNKCVSKKKTKTK